MPLPASMSAAKVVELRQYALKPGARDALVRLFEKELIEPQEAAGMRVGGVFLDRDDPNRFVWFRGFADMATRRQGLEEFYYGPIWKQHRDAANATMIDSDNVLLLRPTDPGHPMPSPGSQRRPRTERALSEQWVVVTVYVHPPNPQLTEWFSTDFHQALQGELRVPVSTFRSEPAANDFPALPVRQDNVFVWSASFAGKGDYAEARRRLEDGVAWRHGLKPRIDAQVTSRQYLRLQPTSRSQRPAAASLE